MRELALAKEEVGLRPTQIEDLPHEGQQETFDLAGPNSYVLTSASPCCLDSCDVNLLHRHDGRESMLGLTATGHKRIGYGARRDLL